MKIYVDMDGVLCNFAKKSSEISGVPEFKIKEYPDDKMWDLIKKEGESYWSTMEWQPGGKELWDFVKDYGPTILSAPIDDKSCHSGKKKWVKEHLRDVPVILEVDKFKHSEPEAILIDDMPKNIDPWKEKGGIGILHKNAKDTIKKLKKYLEDNTEKKVASALDKVASSLEEKGHLKEAYGLDVIANTIEAFETFRNKPVVIDPYDSMVQKAVQALGPALKNVDVIKLEPNCSGNRLAWVSNQDLIKGRHGKQRVIHLCLNKIKQNFKNKYNNSFTISSPEEQKQMQKVIVQFLKDVVIPHETEHIHQEMEHGGEFGPSSEQKAEKVENWKAVEEMGYKKK